MEMLIATRMTEAKSEVPEFTVETEADLTAATSLRTTLRRDGAPWVPSVTDLIVKACATALVQNPRVNSSYVDGVRYTNDACNVGIAVADGEGLVVPVIANAEALDVETIARRSRELAGKVRSGSVKMADVSGGTFTVSNLGMFGVSRFTAIVNVPQVAILAVGRACPMPVMTPSGNWAERQLASLTLTCDHRAVYGVHAAKFLDDVRALLMEPSVLCFGDPDVPEVPT
jgi:pyruvate dehydrogenase E2 component (dihydrolipoamide acetyltransferase)